MAFRRRLLLLSLITLIIFPLLGYVILTLFHKSSIENFLAFEQIQLPNIILGLQFGFYYAFIAYLLMQAKVFEKVSTRIDILVRGLKLNFWEGLFLSFCAGIGEELLFRSGIQPLLGPLITSILFIALHGYLNPFNWRFSIYGLIALPFILLISYSVGSFGLWFAIAAHFGYDAVLFTFMMYENKQKQ